jgi:hypothetical protein
MKFGIRAAAVAAVALVASAAISAPSPGKKLVEFGWDEPDTRFMRDHIAQLQASPFDGCVFHVNYRTFKGAERNFSWDAWGRNRIESARLDSARADLQATRFGRFNENFLRVNVTPGDLDWFEDHSSVMANLEAAARLAEQGGCPGIMLDTEAYRGPLWDYHAQTKAHAHSWDELSAQVRKRGGEAMAALERGYPGLTVFASMAYSMPLEQTRGGRVALADTRYGLLAPFMDGMFAAASDSAVIVDGHENTYPYRDPAKFAARADSARHAARRLAAQPDLYSRRLTVAFGIWLDNDSDHLGWHTDHPESNYFTPAAFAASLQAALDHVDRYVWIYCQKPRWWSDAGVTQNVPAAYDSVLRVARR